MTAITTPVSANEIRFGVEIETCCPNDVRITVGRYHRPVQVPFLPQGWKCSSDCSIQAPFGFYGAEIVSPILCGADGLRQIQKVCQILTDKGFKVNSSTGVHVSVDWGRYTDKSVTERLAKSVAYCEKGLYAMTGTKSREQSHWCRSVKNFRTVEQYMRYCYSPYHEDRYFLLNLTNLLNGQDRVEFRVFSGSINATKIIGWVQVCVGLVQRAKSNPRSAKWDGVENAEYIDKRYNGQGERELMRVQQFLQWQPAQRAKSGGWGLIQNSPVDIDTIIKDQRRLAQKYDQN